MKPRKFLLVSGALIGAISVGILAYNDVVEPHDLTQPVSILSSQAGTDGGSMAIRVIGANGKKLTVERVGNLEVERTLQKMYVVNDVFGVIPLRRAVDKNSPLERETQEMFESLLRRELPMTQQELLNRNDQDALRTAPGNVLAAYDLVTWIRERQR